MRANENLPSRRTFLLGSAAVVAIAAAGVFMKFGRGALAETIVGKPGDVTIEKFSDAGASLGTAVAAKVVKSEAEWKALLANVPQPELAFEVTRQEGTEAAFSGPNWDNHATAGLYRCICCDNALFDAATKYDSGTGWPSFYQPIAKTNVIETSDTTFGMLRTKVSCALCDAHLGHVFDDGPKPTGLRYCMNGVALRFIAKASA